MKKALSKGNNDILDGLTYPYLEKLQRFIPASVHPNSITWVGFFCMLVACFSMMLIKRPFALLVFVVFSLTATACDGLDGIHARKTGQTSIFGDFLDHFLDQLSAGLVMFALLMRFEIFTPLYVAIVLSISTINTLAFVYKSLTGFLHIGALGPTTNLVMLCVALVCVVAFDNPVLFSLRVSDPDVMQFLVNQRLDTINIGKLMLLVPLLSLPFSFYMFYGLAKKHVAEKEASLASPRG